MAKKGFFNSIYTIRERNIVEKCETLSLIVILNKKQNNIL